VGFVRRQPRYLVIGGGVDEGMSQVIRQTTAGGVLRVYCTGASGSSGGSFVDAGSDDGAAMASGDRLGGFALRGNDGTATKSSAILTGFAAENWTDTARGTHVDLYTTAIGAADYRRVTRFHENGDFLPDFNVDVASGKVYKVNGTQVLGAQGAAVADASGGSIQDAEARTALNTLLARMRTHGAIAT